MRLHLTLAGGRIRIKNQQAFAINLWATSAGYLSLRADTDSLSNGRRSSFRVPGSSQALPLPPIEMYQSYHA